MICTTSRCSPSSSRTRARAATIRSTSGRTSESALLASAGVNVLTTDRADTRRRLVAWLILVGVLIAIGYLERIGSGTPDRNVLYRYSTAVSSGVVYVILLYIVLRIAGFRRDLLALRRPRSWGRTVGLMLLLLAVIWVAIL